MSRGKLVKTGALWAKKGKSDYHSGVFDCPHCSEKTNILVFDNNFKENDNHPDKIINRTDDIELKTSKNQGSSLYGSDEDGVPF